MLVVPVSVVQVVVVSLNYRVASLGFLHLGEEGVTGNAGLLDQVTQSQSQSLQSIRHSVLQTFGNNSQTKNLIMWDIDFFWNSSLCKSLTTFRAKKLAWLL